MKHEYWNTDNFPVLLCVGDSNWDYYYRSDAKTNCVACIPKPEAETSGCKASHFGDLWHFLRWGHGRMTAEGVQIVLEKHGTLPKHWQQQIVHRLLVHDMDGLRLTKLRKTELETV